MSERMPACPRARDEELTMLTLRADRISAITWFGESSLFSHFELPELCAASGATGSASASRDEEQCRHHAKASVAVRAYGQVQQRDHGEP
jgi:hypothetical protein